MWIYQPIWDHYDFMTSKIQPLGTITGTILNIFMDMIGLKSLKYSMGYWLIMDIGPLFVNVLFRKNCIDGNSLDAYW